VCCTVCVVWSQTIAHGRRLSTPLQLLAHPQALLDASHCTARVTARAAAEYARYDEAKAKADALVAAAAAASASAAASAKPDGGEAALDSKAAAAAAIAALGVPPVPFVPPAPSALQPVVSGAFILSLLRRSESVTFGFELRQRADGILETMQ
jgi:hypothetical protein